MGFGEFIDHWWNLPFLVMLGLVVVFFGMQAIGIASHGGDADVDHDVDADVDHDVDADADADHDADGHDDADSIGMHDVLAFFGVGRVPFMVVWVILFLFAGLFGLFFNSVFFTRVGTPGVFPAWGFPASLGASLAIALVAVRLFSRALGKLVDVGGKGATTKHDLAGKIGVVASAKIDGKFGEIRVHDDRGNEILVHARLDARDRKRELRRGDEVILVEYDAGSELFTATAGGQRVMTESDGADDDAAGEGESDTANRGSKSSSSSSNEKGRRS